MPRARIDVGIWTAFCRGWGLVGFWGAERDSGGLWPEPSRLRGAAPLVEVGPGVGRLGPIADGVREGGFGEFARLPGVAAPVAEAGAEAVAYGGDSELTNQLAQRGVAHRSPGGRRETRSLCWSPAASARVYRAEAERHEVFVLRLHSCGRHDPQPGAPSAKTIHAEQADVDGLLYASRLTGEDAYAIYDRSVGKLKAGEVGRLDEHVDLPGVLARDGIGLLV